MRKATQKKESILRVPALEVVQGQNRRLYCFAIDGKRLHEFCTVSRVSRFEGENLNGYQRPEVVSHINQIKDYLESENPLLPNAIVVAFDQTVRFKKTPPIKSDATYSQSGILEIPIGMDLLDLDKPGWIVDGQQRSAALRDAKIEQFPVCVVGFIAEGLEEQRQQFILVNATKPLPKGLIYELLPSTEGKLPYALARRKIPALLSERLNYDTDSPLHGIIRTPTNGSGLVADNSVLKMIENSLTDGVLYNFNEMEEQIQVLKNFWQAVSETFPDAWNLPPKKSRLMHGAGFVSMGLLMDTISDVNRKTKNLSYRLFRAELNSISKHCSWTKGSWDFGDNNVLKWNEVQNVPRHIQLLSSHLIAIYRYNRNL